MLHKPEEWTLIRHAPRLKLMKENGRSLRLDDEAKKKIVGERSRIELRHIEKQQPRQVIERMVSGRNRTFNLPVELLIT